MKMLQPKEKPAVKDNTPLTIAVYCKQDEMVQVMELCDKLNLTKSALLRALISQEHASQFPDRVED
jgi:hypothetical protein